MRASVVLALIVGMVLGFGAVRLYSSHNKITVLTSAVPAITECLAQQKAIPCMRGVEQNLLAYIPATTIMQTFSDTLSASQCHYAGHVLGQELYLRTNDVEKALSQCNRLCDTACIHGVINEAFAQTLHTDVSDDEAPHLSRADLLQTGKKLCVSNSTCHGVGHALFESEGHMGTAMAMCAQVATSTSVISCYTGVAMELADTINSRSAHEYAAAPVLKEAAFANLCSMKDIQQKRACYRYLPRVVIDTVKKDGKTHDYGVSLVQSICKALPKGTERIACYFGLGTYSTYVVTDHMRSAIQWCDSYPQPQDKAACFLGQVSVDAGDRGQEFSRYCSALPAYYERKTCFQGLAYNLKRSEIDPNTEVYCLPGDTLCKDAFALYTEAPMDLILKTVEL